ncbi:MAG: hypothetical protein ACTSPM_04910 [Candidatus Heimdallarchaeota archaeon]
MATQDLTQLEEKLFEKIKAIEKMGATARYLPNRVEPGVAYQLNQESRWSRFSGETLFINQQIIANPNLEESIYWREAFLFIAPKELRNTWWVRFLANSFPFSIQQTNEKYEKWAEIWESVIDPKLHHISDYKKLAFSVGSKGIIEIFRLCLHHTFFLQKELWDKRKKLSQIELNLKEFTLIVSKVRDASISLNESAVDLMKIALIKQTLKPKELEKYTDKSKSTIGKTIKKLQDMQILNTRMQVNIQRLGLGYYYMLFTCTRTQYETLKNNLPKHTYLFSYKVHCLTTCTVLLQFVGPRTEKFYLHLEKYCKWVKKTNKIIEFQLFELHNPFKSYFFKYFDPKSKVQNLNISVAAINYNLLREIPQDRRKGTSLEPENIIVKYPQFSKMCSKIDQIDLEIANQVLIGNSTRRGIQKAVKKDMNEVVKRLQYLEEEQVLTEDVSVKLPNSSEEVTLFIEEIKSKIEPFLKERMKILSNYLPDVFFSEVRGTYNGIMMHLSLPYSNILQFVNFINFFLPSIVNIQIILGRPKVVKLIRKLPVDRWTGREWLFYNEDFEM